MGRKEDRRLKQRSYAYAESLQIASGMVLEAKQRYDYTYTLAAIAALNSAPFNFGKKRMAEFLNLFLGQIDGLINGHIEPDDLLDTAKRLDILMYHYKNKFIVDLGGANEKRCD
jgi:hypothetical protein